MGCKLYAAGAERLKKIQCEMGGKNPVVVLADADLQLAMESRWPERLRPPGNAARRRAAW